MDHPTPPKTKGLAAVITDRRKALGLSQNAVAAAAAIAGTTFVRRMQRNDWTITELAGIATALDTTVADLVTEADEAA